MKKWIRKCYYCINKASDNTDEIFLTSECKIISNKDISIHYDNKIIDLDPVRKSNGDYRFISHAHMDHMRCVSAEENVIASNETVFLASRRGITLKPVKKIPEDLKLVDTGHILGSRGFILGEGKIFYTSDFAVKPRAFLKGCTPKKCDTLIIESTFGKKDFVFPSVSDIQNDVNQLISEIFSLGKPIILMGYSLGKAQILSHLFSSWDPIFVEKSAWDMNNAYIDLGVNIRNDLKEYDKDDNDVLEKKPWVLIAPLKNGYSNFVSNLKKKYGAVTIAFSGWSTDSRYKYKMNVDHAFPLSDHCDFNELVDMVKRCDPQQVYTIHGFEEEFASHLRSLGFNARSLTNTQTSMSEYII